MRKIFFFLTFFILSISAFFYLEQKYIAYKTQIKIDKTKTFVNILEELKIAGKAECFYDNQCNVINGANKYFYFDNVSVKNYDDLFIFFSLFSGSVRYLVEDVLYQNKLDNLLFVDGKYFKKDVGNNFNKKGNFSFQITNLKLSDIFKDEFIFLTWYIDKSTYEKILDILDHVDLNIDCQYVVNNGILDLDKLYLKLDLVKHNSYEIKTFIKNKSIEIKFLNYDLLKSIILEFQEMIKTFFENNINFLFAKDILKHLEVITNEQTNTFSIIQKNIKKSEDSIFIFTIKNQIN